MKEKVRFGDPKELSIDNKSYKIYLARFTRYLYLAIQNHAGGRGQSEFVRSLVILCTQLDIEIVSHLKCV